MPCEIRSAVEYGRLFGAPFAHRSCCRPARYQHPRPFPWHTKELMQAFSHYRPTRRGATAKPSGLSSRLHIVSSNLRWAVCAAHAVNSAMELSEASRLRPMVQSSPLVDLAGRIRRDCDVVLRGVISRTQYNRPRVFQTRYLAKPHFRDRSLSRRKSAFLSTSRTSQR